MTRRPSWLRATAAAVALALAVLLAAVGVVGVIAANPPAQLAERALDAATAAFGRPIFAERIETALWPAPVVILHDVTSARAPGPVRPGLITARRVELSLAPWALAAGELRLKRVRVVEPRLTADIDVGALASLHPGGARAPHVSIEHGGGRIALSIGAHILPVTLEDVRAVWPGSGAVAIKGSGRIGAGAPFALSGLWRPGVDDQRLEIFSGSLGAGHMSGTLVLTPGRHRALVTVTLALGALDLDGLYRQLVALDWGLDPAAADAEPPRRLLSDRPFALSGLRAVDLDLALTADTASVRGIDMESLRLNLELSDGLLELARTEARLGDGRADLTVRVDGFERRYRLDLLASDVPAQALGLANPLSRSQGDVSLALDLEAAGHNAREVAESLTGSATLSLHDAWLAADTSEMVAAVFPWTRDRLGLVIERAEARATIERGVIEDAAAMIRTPEVELAAAGIIDLASESLYLDLVPVRRGAGTGGELVPLILAGPMAQPALLPNPPAAEVEPEGGEE